jgi:mono/diheme cytochrome c family protein
MSALAAARWLVSLALVAGVGVDAAAAGPAANYLLRCSGCHGADGSGAPQSGIPPFPGFLDPFYRDAEGRRYLLHVPGVASSGLKPEEIATVLNLLAQRWGTEPASLPAFTEEEVRQRQAEPVADLVGLRQRLAARYQAAGQPVAPYPWP